MSVTPLLMLKNILKVKLHCRVLERDRKNFATIEGIGLVNNGRKNLYVDARSCNFYVHVQVCLISARGPFCKSD